MHRYAELLPEPSPSTTPSFRRLLSEVRRSKEYAESLPDTQSEMSKSESSVSPTPQRHQVLVAILSGQRRQLHDSAKATDDERDAHKRRSFSSSQLHQRRPSFSREGAARRPSFSQDTVQRERRPSLTREQQIMQGSQQQCSRSSTPPQRRPSLTRERRPSFSRDGPPPSLALREAALAPPPIRHVVVKREPCRPAGTSGGGPVGAGERMGRRSSRSQGALAVGVAHAAREVNTVAHELLRGEVSNDMPLMEAGLDSLGVMEFHSRLSRRLGVPGLPETLVFDYPTLRQLESYTSNRAAEGSLGWDYTHNETNFAPEADVIGRGAVPGSGALAGLSALEHLTQLNQLVASLGLIQQGPETSRGASRHGSAAPLRPTRGQPLLEATCGLDPPEVRAVVSRVTHGLIKSLSSADTPLLRAGLDSLAAVELRSQLSKSLGFASLPETIVFDYPTLRQLQQHMASRITESARTPDDAWARRRRSHQTTDSTKVVAPAADLLTASTSLAGVLAGVPLSRAASDSLHKAISTALGASTTPPKLRPLASPFAPSASEPVLGVQAALAGGSVRLPGRLELAKRRGREAQAASLLTGAIAIEDLPAARGWSLEDSASVPANVAHGGLMAHVECFDHERFSVSISEARAMDPQQRLVLEHGYEALHAASRPMAELHRAASVGVALGIYALDFKEVLGATPAGGGVYAATGATLSVACGRVSYVLGLHGPCVSVDTACSSALVAAHSAQINLHLEGSTDRSMLSLAAGVNTMLIPEVAHRFANASMLSKLGRCHAFDRRADGFVRAEGCCAVAVEPRSGTRDAILDGVGVRQDGRSASLTAPNGQAQQLLLRCAHEARESQVDAVETHGTGTALGDPIEVGALSGGLGRQTDDHGVLPLSSIKGNVGHTESTAGLAGLMALVLSLQMSAMSPNAQLRELNPHLSSSVADAGAMLSVQLSDPLMASTDGGGVSSFGYSGTIAHASVRLGKCDINGVTELPLSSVALVGYRRRSFHWIALENQPLTIKPAAWLLARSTVAAAAIDAFVEGSRSPPSQSDAVVVGSGLAGLIVAASLSSDGGLATCVLEKSRVVGGVWRHHGNMLSRVNSSEPSYRLPVRTSSNPNTNHSHHHEILADVLLLLEQYHLARAIHTRAEVTSVAPPADPESDPTRTVSGQQTQSPEERSTAFGVKAPLVVVCTNRRLGQTRELLLQGENGWAGQVRRGLSSDVASIRWRGAHAVVLGMGAFAVECMRSALEGSAGHVHLLCRRRGTTCPQIVDWIYFVRPRVGDGWAHSAAGDARVLTAWQRAYDATGATRPECWSEGLLKPDGHTVSVSDMFFAGHHLELVQTQLGEAARLELSGVRTLAGELIRASVLVKCVGFEKNEGNVELLRTRTMRGFGLVDANLWVQVRLHCPHSRRPLLHTTLSLSPPLL